MSIPAVTTAEMRNYARWPDAVPDPFLAPHLDGAARDVSYELRGQVAAGMEADAAEAIMCLAVASALPFIHTFTQDGAVSAIRSAQMAVGRPHFQGADDQSGAIKRLKDRAETLLSRLRQAAAKASGGETGGEVLGDLYMGAI